MLNEIILILIYVLIGIAIIYGIFSIICDFKYAIRRDLGLEKIKNV